ncbi:unnamed protein product [Schistosoma curassoni]|uniref:DUF6451 domain-containing protein n=1 Tax=Schistosoma curassoni TaxID=6186 RepID=A0A183K2H1_9TREM|nr:unnamed protein product [Schistosoma curassoni]
MMTSVAAASAAVGLNIHKGKSKIRRYNTAYINPITIEGEDLEDVKTFTYLGSIIDEQGGSDANVKAQIGKARAADLQMKNIWNSKQLSTNTKIRIFNTNVKTVLLDPLSTNEILSKFDENVPEELDLDDLQSNVVHPHHLATSIGSSIQCKKSVLNKVPLIVTWAYEDPTLFRGGG